MISQHTELSIELSKQIMDTMKGNSTNKELFAKLDVQEIINDDFFRPVVFVFDDDTKDPYCIITPGVGDNADDLRELLAASVPLMPVKTLVLVQDAFMKTVAKETNEELYPEGMSIEQQYLLGNENVHQALTVLAIDSEQKVIAASLIYKETDDGKLVWGEEQVNDKLNLDAVGGAFGKFLSKAASELTKSHEERVKFIWSAFLESDQSNAFVSDEKDRTIALAAFEKLMEDEEPRQIVFRILEDNILTACKFIPLQQSDRMITSRDKLDQISKDSETFKCLQQAKLID